MSSNIKIPKTCEFCLQQFIAKTTVTKFCSHNCSRKAYKQRIREQKISESISRETEREPPNHSVLKTKEFLSIEETCQLLGASRWTIYRLIQNGRLPINKLGRRTIIKRENINQLISAL